MNPPNELEIVNFKFHMTNVVRQKDENSKDTLSSMRIGTSKKEQYKFLISRCFSNIDKETRMYF